MFIPIICFVGGLCLMGKTKPDTKVWKMIALGPKSGVVYTVEDFREIGTLVIRSPDKKATAQFVRARVRQPGKPGLVYQNGFGDPETLRVMLEDFAVMRKPEAVKSREPDAGSRDQKTAP